MRPSHSTNQDRESEQEWSQRVTHIPARVGGRTAHAQRAREEEEGAGGGQRNNSLCSLHCCSSLPAFAAPAGEEGMATDATLAAAHHLPTTLGNF